MQRTLIHVPVRFATVPMSGACARLERDIAQVEELIDAGKLRCVWNIATPGATKRELRFLFDELRTFPEPHRTDPHFLAGLLFGDAKPFVDGTVFRRAFLCDPDHVLNLIRAGALEVLPNTGWRRGPNGTPAIAWASAVRFVKERMIA